MTTIKFMGLVLSLALAGCGGYRKAFGPHHRSPSPEPVSAPPADKPAFYQACDDRGTPEASRNLVNLVLAHPLIATQDCLAASQKLERLTGISLMSAKPGLMTVNLAPLANAKELKLFAIDNVKIESIETLAALPKLANIMFAHITSLDLSPLKHAKNLRSFTYSPSQRPDFADPATMCPTGPDINAEIDSYCRLYRVHQENSSFGGDNLVGTWEDYIPGCSFRLTIDENFNYTLAFIITSGEKTELRSEQGTVQSMDSESTDDGYFAKMQFKPTTPSCLAQSLTKTLSPNDDGMIPYLRDLDAQLRLKLKGPARLHMQRATHAVPDGLTDLGCSGLDSYGAVR